MRFSEADAVFNKSQESVLHVFAFHCLLNGQPEKAEPIYSLLLACMPDSKQVRCGLACAQLQNGVPEDALLTLTPVIDDPDPMIQLLQSKVLLKLGRTANAGEAMQRFCAVRPVWRKPVLVDADKTIEKKRDKTQ